MRVLFFTATVIAAIIAPVSEAINIETALSPVSPVTPSNQSVGSADMSAGMSGQSVPQLEPVITLPEIIARGGEIAMLGAIKQE